MAEPTIQLELNDGTEATPVWATIVTAARWVGPDAVAGTLTDPFVAPIADGDEAFFDFAASPNDGELWHDKATDEQIVTAGRTTDRNTLRALETGATDATADPPEFTAYDDATDASNRTNPTVWLLVGTAGSSNISVIRAVETTVAAGGAGWTAQVHDTAPGGGTSGEHLDGDQTGQKEICATILAASGNKTFQLAACAPHDSTSGETSFVYAFQYTFQ